MSRFKFEGDYAMRVVDGKGSLLAYFNVVDTKIGIEFRDCRLMEGKNGVFVGPPFRSYEKDGETKYADYWRPAFDGDERNEDGVAYVEEMAEAAYEYYQSIADEKPKKASKAAPKGGSKGRSAYRDEEEETDDDEKPSRQSRPASRSGRGPVPTTGGKGKKDLPF